MNTAEFKKDWQDKIAAEQSPGAAAVRTMARLYTAFPEPGALGLLEATYSDWKRVEKLAEGSTKS